MPTQQAELLEESTFAKVYPIKLVRKLKDLEAAFQPVVLAEVQAMPEGELEEKIAKAIAVLKWPSQCWEICFSYSGGYEADGVTWHEIDRSKRGADREAALAALVRRTGGNLEAGDVLRRVVVHAKNERILKRALAILRDHVKASDRPQAPTDRTIR